ncbi:MAG: hypothetical protein JSW66_01835 [Phycisphaerales bacterium]|nr:MAG: hypothetical protein JSW66_01835 [Phycisphaerales bacterium]
MKRYVLMSLLLAGLFACPAVFSRDFEREDAEFDMGVRERQMELEHRQAQMETERQMQRLELDERRLDLERAHDGHDKDEMHGLLLLIVVVHILLAVWVYMDIRQLNRGSGIWIVLVLLAGLLSALVYAVVRLGDNRQDKS